MMFNLVLELNKHLLSIHESNFSICNQCDKLFSKKSLLDEHFPESHDDAILAETQHKEEEVELQELSGPVEIIPEI